MDSPFAGYAESVRPTDDKVIMERGQNKLSPWAEGNERRRMWVGLSEVHTSVTNSRGYQSIYFANMMVG